jgi:hypothetical protein
MRQNRSVSDLRSSFVRLLKTAARPYQSEGWRVRGAGLVLHAGDGCWGQIVFSGASRKGDRPLSMGLTAGTCAPYLMKVVNKLDAAKPPTRNFVAAHTRVMWMVGVVFAQTGSPVAASFDLARRQGDPAVELTPETAGAWLADAFSLLVPATQALCSNAAIYDWLTAPRERDSSFNVRYALLLGRHLGLDSDLPELERRAESLYLREFGLRDERDTRAADRQKNYPQDWSHQRFMRFLESVPR